MNFLNFGRVWAMHPDYIRDFLTSCEKYQGQAMPEAFSPGQDTGPGYSVNAQGVATIAMIGPVVKSAPWWFEYLGIEATDVNSCREQLAAAVNDTNVTSIKLLIDSPGGTIGGVQALAEDIRRARDTMPIEAQIDGMAASAAYWIAAQATSITGGLTSSAGAIGVYLVLDDASEAFEAEGVTRHVISSHELKGAGVYGAKLTEAQIADFQREIDAFASIFVEQVAQGRGVDKGAIEKLATGQVWIGSEAAALGLIDSLRVQSSTAKAPVGASGARAMEEKLALLEADNGRLMAENEDFAQRMKALEEQAGAQAEALAVAKATQRETLISQYRDSIAPAALESVREYGEFCGNDSAKFETFLQSMTVVLHKEPEGATAEANLAPEPVQLSASENAVLEILSPQGLTPEAMKGGN